MGNKIVPQTMSFIVAIIRMEYDFVCAKGPVRDRSRDKITVLRSKRLLFHTFACEGAGKRAPLGKQCNAVYRLVMFTIFKSADGQKSGARRGRDG